MIRITSFAGLISTIPASLGTAPTESLVALALTEKRLGATLRVDLPDSITKDFVDSLAGYLAADKDATRYVLALYSHRDQWELELMAATVTVLLEDATGLPVVDTALIMADSWYDCTAGTTGHLLELDCTEFSASVIAHGKDKTDTAVPDAEAPLTLDGVDTDPEYLLGFWAGLLHADDPIRDADLTGVIAGVRSSKLVRDALFVEVLAEGVGEAMDIDAYGPVLLGILPGAFDHARWARGKALLRRAAALADGEDRSDLLAGLGWLHWIGGNGSAALAHFNAADALTPGHRLATLLHTLVSRGQLSPVAQVKANWLSAA